MLQNKKPSLDQAILKDVTQSTSRFNTGKAENAASILYKRADKLEKNMQDLASQIGYDPTVAGIGDRKAHLADDEWIRDALILLKRDGPELYLRNMIDQIRKTLGGIPKLSASNKNHPCPCGSNKKFGKCCGILIEDADPDSCKVAGHSFGFWGRVKPGTWVHTCTACSAVETAEDALEIGCEGENVVVIPCRACGAKPDQDAGWEIYSAKKKLSCIACKKVPKIETLVIEHQKEGKHAQEWHDTSLIWVDRAWQIEMKGLISNFVVHTTCLKEHGVKVREDI